MRWRSDSYSAVGASCGPVAASGHVRKGGLSTAGSRWRASAQVSRGPRLSFRKQGEPHGGKSPRSSPLRKERREAPLGLRGDVEAGLSAAGTTASQQRRCWAPISSQRRSPRGKLSLPSVESDSSFAAVGSPETTPKAQLYPVPKQTCRRTDLAKLQHVLRMS